MSELPDDMNQWPRDCFDLFGISNSASEKELRRAYFRLIKKFKPDRFPSEFQRIHEAYELAQRRLENAQHYDEESDFWQPPAKLPSKNSTPVVDSTKYELSPQEREHTSTESDSIDRFWELAGRGLLEEAVSIVPKITSKKDRDQISFSEYFFRRTASDRTKIESCRYRIELRVKCLEHPQLGQNAFFYLASELDADPELAKLDVIEEFINSSPPTVRTHELARLRWCAVGHQHPELVVSDMSTLMNDFSRDAQHSASEAIEYTIWHRQSDFEEFIQRCQQLLEDSQSELADWVDLLVVSAKELDTATGLWNLELFKSLIPGSRTGFKSHLANEWRPMIKALCSKKRLRILDKLDSVVESIPVSMTIFLAGLMRLSQIGWEVGYSGPPPIDHTRTEVSSFLSAHQFQVYDRQARDSILTFCIEHHIAPQAFGAIADQFVHYNEANLLWSEILRRDTSLNCLFHASLAQHI